MRGSRTSIAASPRASMITPQAHDVSKCGNGHCGQKFWDEIRARSQAPAEINDKVCCVRRLK